MPRSPVWASGIPRRSLHSIWLWRARGTWVQELHRTEGSRDSTLGGCTQGFMCPGTQGKAVTPQEWVRPTCRFWRVSWGGGDWLWPTVGQGHWQRRPQGIFFNVSSPGGHHLVLGPGPTQQPASSSAGGASGQPTGWEHSPSNQPTQCLKLSWVHRHLKTCPLTWSCSQEGQEPAPSTSWQAPVTTTGKPVQTPEPTSTTKGQTWEARTTIQQPTEGRPQTQNETAEKYVPDEGTR